MSYGVVPCQGVALSCRGFCLLKELYTTEPNTNKYCHQLCSSLSNASWWLILLSHWPLCPTVVYSFFKICPSCLTQLIEVKLLLVTSTAVLSQATFELLGLLLTISLMTNKIKSVNHLSAVYSRLVSTVVDPDLSLRICFVILLSYCLKERSFCDCLSKIVDPFVNPAARCDIS